MGRADIGWTFLTNHAAVYLTLARDPEILVRDVAEQVGITERSVLAIIKDLAADGYIEVERRGRRNHYTIVPARPMRHPRWRSHQVAELLDLLPDGPSGSEQETA